MMQFPANRSREEVLAALQDAALAAWGPTRRDDLQAVLEVTATHIWRVAQEPLDSPEDLPDFLDRASSL